MENNNENINNDENYENNAPEENEIKEDKSELVESKKPEYVSPDSVDEIVVNTDTKSKKLPIIIACVVVVVLIVIVVAVVIGGKNKNVTAEASTGEKAEITTVNNAYDDEKINAFLAEEATDEEGNSISVEEYQAIMSQKTSSLVQEATTLLSGNVGTQSPNVVTEVTTAPIKEGATVSDTTQSKKDMALIDAFFGNSYYMKGATYMNNEGTPLAMSIDGDNYEILSNIEGADIAIVKIDGKIYLKRNALKQYAELTDSFMSMMGLSIDDLANFGFATGADPKFSYSYNVKLNGKDAVCYVYKSSGGSAVDKFYFIGGEMKQIDVCNADGTVSDQLALDSFTDIIPVDQLTLKGYTQGNLIEMFADLM